MLIGIWLTASGVNQSVSSDPLLSNLLKVAESIRSSFDWGGFLSVALGLSLLFGQTLYKWIRGKRLAKSSAASLKLVSGLQNPGVLLHEMILKWVTFKN